MTHQIQRNGPFQNFGQASPAQILPKVQYAAARSVPLARPTYDRIAQRQQIGLSLGNEQGRINDTEVNGYHEITLPLRALEHL